MPLPKEPIGPTVPGVSWSALLGDEPAISADDDESPVITALPDQQADEQ